MSHTWRYAAVQPERRGAVSDPAPSRPPPLQHQAALGARASITPYSTPYRAAALSRRGGAGKAASVRLNSSASVRPST